jgi:hypothetical protein
MCEYLDIYNKEVWRVGGRTNSGEETSKGSLHFEIGLSWCLWGIVLSLTGLDNWIDTERREVHVIINNILADEWDFLCK